MFACTIHSTVTVDEIREEQKRTNQMLAKLTKLIEAQSDKDKALEKEVKGLGGREAVINSPELIIKIAAKIEGRPTTEKQPPADGAKFGSSISANKDRLMSKQELLELSRPLDELLAESLPYFKSKLEVQMERLSEQLELSTQQILHRLDAGAYQKVNHPDLRTLGRRWYDPASTLLCCQLLMPSRRSGTLQSSRGISCCACMTITWTVSLLRKGGTPPSYPLWKTRST